MWFVVGGLAAFAYILLIATLGMATLRNGHWIMFIAGIFLPLFWLFGALMPRGKRPRRSSPSCRRLHTAPAATFYVR